MIDEHGIDSGKTAPEETRERILAAAREVMARKGKRGATTREIAETAGVNEATLFRHFGNKEALIVATAQHYCGAIELRGVLAQLPGDLEGDLFAIGSLMLERMTRLRDMIRWSLVEDDYEQSIFSKATWRRKRRSIRCSTSICRAASPPATWPATPANWRYSIWE